MITLLIIILVCALCTFIGMKLDIKITGDVNDTGPWAWLYIPCTVICIFSIFILLISSQHKYLVVEEIDPITLEFYKSGDQYIVKHTKEIKCKYGDKINILENELEIDSETIKATKEYRAKWYINYKTTDFRNRIEPRNLLFIIQDKPIIKQKPLERIELDDINLDSEKVLNSK